MLKNILIFLAVIILSLAFIFRNQIRFIVTPYMYFFSSNVLMPQNISYSGDKDSMVNFFSPHFSFKVISRDASTTSVTEVKDENTVISVNWVSCEDSIFENVDAKTFAPISLGSENRSYFNYAKDSNSIYYHDNCGHVRKLDQADVNTFVVIDNYFKTEEYAKDRNYVYYHGYIIPNADPETFALTTVDNSKGFKDLVIKDKNRTYDDSALYDTFIRSKSLPLNKN
jgi:hypothetical protein